jgi:hypothetical protein
MKCTLLLKRFFYVCVICTDAEAVNDSISKQLQQVKVQRGSTFEKHATWLLKVHDGYICQLCKEFGAVSQQSSGIWTTIPLPLSVSKKLHTKADKQHVV